MYNVLPRFAGSTFLCSCALPETPEAQEPVSRCATAIPLSDIPGGGITQNVRLTVEMRDRGDTFPFFQKGTLLHGAFSGEFFEGNRRPIKGAPTRIISTGIKYKYWNQGEDRWIRRN
jgi:hypothetical protein